MAVSGERPGRAGVKPRRLPRAERERQMLDAAVATFAERGYRAASMDDIAERAGVSKPLVYLYLNSKEDLFTACIRREAEALSAAVREAVDPASDAEHQLWEGLHAFFTHTAEHPDGWTVLHSQARAQGDPFVREVLDLRAEIVAFVTTLIVAAAREAHGDPELGEREVAGLAQALVGAAESLAQWAGTRTSATAREAAATLMRLAWPGLNSLMHGPRWTPPAS